MKYFLNSNDKEVKIGDTVAIDATVDTPFGPTGATIHITVTHDNLTKMLEHHIIRKGKELSPSLCLELIAEKLHFTTQETEVLLKEMGEANMYAPAIQMLLKAASDYLSPGTKVVRTLPKVYTISLIDGRIHEVQTTDISNYNHFAYFVSKTQAKKVRDMFRDVFNAMYGESKNTECSS